MTTRLSFLKKLALVASGLGLAFALFVSSGLVNAVSAQSVGVLPVYGCPAEGIPIGTAPAGAFFQFECHYYDYFKSINDEALKSFQFAVVMGLLNSMQFFTQQLAIGAAQFLLNGTNGQGTAYYNQTFGSFLANAALNSANVFLSNINDYTKGLGFNICAPITINLKLALGIGSVPLPTANCTFQTITANFESTYRSLQPEQLAQTLKSSIQPGGNDLSVALSTNQAFLNKIISDQQASILDRQEGGGLLPLTNLISGQIQTPAQVAKDTVTKTNAISLIYDQTAQSNNALAFAAFQAGLKQLPIIAASTFASTLAVGLLQKFFSALSSTSVAVANLSNPSAQTTGAPVPVPVAITDIVTPNLLSSSKEDFLFDLSTCNADERGTWGCSIDGGFVAALQSETDSGGYTIARAAGIGATGPSGGNIFLHSDWQLIPETDAADNQDPGCYLRAYCSSNLAKLRFARIISIGWELAANSPFNTKVNGQYATLGQVVSGFNDCNAQGEIDAQHPWCHLINPGWVLTEPQFQCNLSGYGDTVISSPDGTAGLISRIQECEDVVSCLQRDDHGNCIGGYGYCLSERPVWRFGADECDQNFVSCRTYDTRDKSVSLNGANASSDTNTGPQVSYLRNTIDYGSCSADNIGCQYYFDLRDTSTTATDQWVGDEPAGTKLYGEESVYKDGNKSLVSPREYFDATVQTCDAADDGCTKVYTVTPGQSAFNFIQNGSFENTSAADSTSLTGWSDAGSVHYSFVNFVPSTADPAATAIYGGTASFDGGQSVSFGITPDTSWHEPIKQRVTIAPLRNYVLSFYARNGDGGAPPQANVAAFLLDKDGNKVASSGQSYYRSTNCSTDGLTSGGDFYDVGQTANTRPSASMHNQSTPDWTRYTCEFVSNSDAQYADIVVRGDDVAIDAIQLEEGTVASPFVDGDNLNSPVDYLKIPPPELACNGTPQDRSECGNYARVCPQTAAGCQGYTDTGGGDPTEIPATLNANDYCPGTCVGYAEYLKQPSAFDLTKSANPVLNDPDDQSDADFIPKSAQTCSAQAVGCTEFTNVEAAANGGEQTLFLTYARACQKPSDLTRTYFTWEGADTTGYQLRTWSLVASSAAASAPPQIIQKSGPDGIFKDPSMCTEASWKTGADPDCRQFYDTQGDVFYVYYSQTVVSSADCRDYRKDDSTIADCQKTGGDYDQNTKECVYHILSDQSTTCSAQDAECRAYIGTTGRNTVSVYSENFANATGTLFAVEQGSSSKISYSTESLLVGDYSLKVQGSNQPSAVSTFTTFPSATNTLYTLSFWAKSTDASHPTVTIKMNQGSQVVGSFVLQTDWTRYEIGPFMVNANVTSSFIGWWGLPAAPNSTFLDDVNIQRLQDVVYAKQNSWTTPPECDQTATGVPQPQAMLGCRQYVDRTGKTVDVRQFSQLCQYANVGCTGYVDTQNSDNPYSQTFVEQGAPPGSRPWDDLFSGTVTTTRPEDSYVYLIDEPSAHCDASNMSCRAFGQPQYDENLNVTGVKTIYLKDDVTQYVDSSGEPQMLCRPSELYCDRFTSQTANPPVISYFRDPMTHTCTWQDKVEMSDLSGTYNGKAYTIPAGEYSGWFVDGAPSPTPCDPTELSSGNTFLNDYSAAAKYDGFVSTCPAEQAECTEFRDPNDHSDISHPLGRSYYFLDNSHLDKTTCAGSVSPFDGCVLFRDMNDSELTFSVAATYADSHANDDSPVAPINCDSDPTNPNCTAKGTCDNDSTKSCTTDSQCGSGTCQLNDANLILKVKLDRDCQTWLGCATGETVYDPGQQQYVDLCENLAVCDTLGAADSNYCGHYLDRSPSEKITKSYTSAGFYEPVLRKGIFLDAFTYASRPVDFGSPDYSSYALPNHFQVADTVTRPVGYDLLANYGNIRFNYYHDYRNVAAIPLCGNVGVAGYAGCAKKYTDQAFPKLNLCQQQQTGQIGYWVPSDNPSLCYLSIEAPYAQDVNDYLEQPTGINPVNAQNTATLFDQLIAPLQDQALSDAYPPAECKAYPAANSPFPNSYVTAWDFTKNPPAPTAFVDGYSGATYCQYGEDCSCSYRDVNYGSTDKYYSLYDDNSPEGICVGGANDGQACIPGASQQGSSSSSEPSVTPTNSSSAYCSGGSCEAVQNVTLVRGIYGQCLEHDTARTIAGSQSFNPCLIWDPAPVLFGQNDVYHYEPTAGYLPPQNSGEYYCVSNALAPSDLSVPAFVPNPNGDDPYRIQDQYVTPPGAIDASSDYNDAGDGFNYDDIFVSDGDCFACTGAEGTFIDGQNALGGTMGSQCEDADDNEDDSCDGDTCPNGFIDITANLNSHMANYNAGRWITTGRGASANYAEYFIPLSPQKWTEFLNNNKNTSIKAVDDAMLESNFAYFNFNPIPDAGNGIIGCGYSQDWVDGVTVDDYDDNAKLKQGSTSWVTAFNSAFAHALTPDSANFLTNANSPDLTSGADAVLQKVPCYYTDDVVTNKIGNNTGDGTCYIKYWQVGYQDSGQQEFQMESTADGTNGPGWTLNATAGAWQDAATRQTGRTLFLPATGSKPYFSIRAVFEDTSINDNVVPPKDEDPTGNALAGPFRFVGFWITAATPSIQDERAIYMTLDISHADICDQVAQVVAPDTREAVPFMDRVSAASGFTLPGLGISYSSVNEPFGSAKSTQPIGRTPLFQTNQPQPGSNSVLRPSPWVSSGATFFTPTPTPADNWGWLTNLFAKVYRVYQYYSQPVSKISWECVVGPRAGTWCPDLTQDYANQPYVIGNGGGISNAGVKAGQMYCGFAGSCDTSKVDPTKGQPLCNALSGVNRGLTCSTSLTDPVTGYNVCHEAPVQIGSNGVPTPQYTSCDLVNGWQVDPQNSSAYYSVSFTQAYLAAGGSGVEAGLIGSGTNAHAYNGTQTMHRGGLRCNSKAVKDPDGQPAPCDKWSNGQASTECPIEVDPVSHVNPPSNPGPGVSWCEDIDSSGEGHCANGYQTAACTNDADCEFTWEEWWNDNGAGSNFPGGGGSSGEFSANTYQGARPYDYLDQALFNNQQFCDSLHGSTDPTGICVPNGDSGAPPGELLGTDRADGATQYGETEYWGYLASLDTSGDFAKLCESDNPEDNANNPNYDPAYDNTALTKYCAIAFYHGGEYKGPSKGQTGDPQTFNGLLGGVPHKIGVFPTYDPVAGENSYGTPDFPYTGTPYATGYLLDSDNLWGNVWWDGSNVYQDDGDSSHDSPSGPCDSIADDNNTGCNSEASTDDPDPTHPDVDIGKKNLMGSRYVAIDDTSSPGFAYPGAFAAGKSAYTDNGSDDIDLEDTGHPPDIFIPGHCEKPPVDPVPGYDGGADFGSAYGNINLGYYDAPYYRRTVGLFTEGNLLSGSFPTVTRYYQGAGRDWTPGVCSLGALDGKSCTSDVDCVPQGYDKNAQAISWGFCQPVSVTNSDGSLSPSVATVTLPGPSIPTLNPVKWSCALPAGVPGDPNSVDLDTDDNICTHNAGYYPETALCGNNPDREECLNGVEQDDSGSFNPTKAPLPTDVTAGLYTPLYLGKDVNTYSQNYNYVSFYTPSPPMIAAPDTKQSCPAPGQCPIALVNTFSLENQAEGKVAYVGGQALASVRFYGWAADNQAPLKDMWVDWGDDNVQQISDAEMKNKKPFCGVSSECEFVPGLTCNSDADCPPAAGKCVAVGYCNAHPDVSCKTDDD
ncbi:MAG: hypothetical protein WA001_02185 [Patescibacteria group bacterium]